MTTLKAEELDAFFPHPSPPPSSLGPARLAGATHASSAALVKVLKDNHVKWHAFFNDQGFHNHASHHLLAIYALGAGGPLIDAAYQTHVSYMRPAFESPEPIAEKNFWLHLGKKDFYNSYLVYFRSQLREKDITDVIEEYVFSAKANVGGAGIEGEPLMLTRFLGGLLHPIIHTAYGLEFGILGLVAEGLAQTAVHEDYGKELLPASVFQQSKGSTADAVSRLTALLPSLSLSKGNGSAAPQSGGSRVHAFSILARVLADPRFAPNVGFPLKEKETSAFEPVSKAVGDSLAELAGEWAAELDGEGATLANIEAKIEELAWLSAIIYGVGGWGARDRSPNKKFIANFYYMHLVTSTLFLPSIVAYISPRSAAVLLRAYFASSLALYISQGRPSLPIREFYANSTDKPTPPATNNVTPTKGTLTPEDVAPNPWLPIIQTTLVHPGEHVCKLQRALMHYASVYGTRKAGDFAGTGLEGAEVLDGTLFIRIAGLSADRLSWMKEGQAETWWDRIGFN